MTLHVIFNGLLCYQLINLPSALSICMPRNLMLHPTKLETTFFIPTDRMLSPLCSF